MKPQHKQPESWSDDWTMLTPLIHTFTWRCTKCGCTGTETYSPGFGGRAMEDVRIAHWRRNEERCKYDADKIIILRKDWWTNRDRLRFELSENQS